MVICKYESCGKHANFGVEGGSAQFCFTHKEENMIDMTHKQCEFLGCNTQPYFNIPGNPKGRFCGAHKQENMIDVKNEQCEFLGCNTRPNFNFPGETKRRFCGAHKQENMINVTNRRCKFESCNKIPSYNVPGETQARFCFAHKQENMINVKNKRCEFEECSKQPSYNIPEEIRPRFCFAHKQENMINVKNKQCKFEGCTTGASFGPLFMRKIHCAKHKTDNEYKNNNPKCSTENCNNIPSYTDDESNFPKRCYIHCTSSDVELEELNCKICSVPSILNNETRICNSCSPRFVKGKRKKVREDTVRDFLKARGFDFVSEDKTVYGACSKYRPDFVIDFNEFFCIVEVDENQHKGRAYECEEGRMLQIHQDCGGVPIVFIRYNPDSYHIFKDGKPFGPAIRGNRSRLCVLESTINGLKNRYINSGIWKDPVRVCYLFYDGYDGVPETKPLNYESYFERWNAKFNEVHEAFSNLEIR